MSLDKKLTKNSLWPAFSRMNHPDFSKSEVTFVRGSGATLYDSSGKPYFDGFSTLWTNLVGHGRPEIIDAIKDQYQKLSFMHVFSGHSHEAAHQLSDVLTSQSPFKHSHCFFGVSGSDATETAMKMARSFWFAQGKPDKNVIVGRYSEYHGTSLGALSLMGWDALQTSYKPLIPKVERLQPPNCYHCPWGKERSSCNTICKSSFREYFEKIDARNTVAAVLIEPIITSDGLITPPAEYWEHVQEACREYEVLIIADEVSTGMGRTGKLYASSWFGLNPDITYLAKSLSSGYAPLSAVLTSDKIFQGIHENKHYFSHGTTFGGHPVACVASLKVLEILQRELLVERANEIEKLLLSEFDKLIIDLPIVGNIRGKGALFEIELVADNASKYSHTDEVTLAMRVFSECMKRGQYLRCLGRFICIAPPLISTDEEIRNLVHELRGALIAVQNLGII